MKLSRCPWCGEKAIPPLPPKINRNILMSEADNTADRCKNCSMYYYDFSAATNKFVSFSGTMLIVSFFIGIILIICGRDDSILGIPMVLNLVLFLFSQHIATVLKPAYLKYSESTNKIIPFTYSFNARIKFKARSDGGYLLPKKHFYNDIILGARFKVAEKSINRYLYKTDIALVFDDVKYEDKNTATCKVGFILDEKIDKSFLKQGLEFSLAGNKPGYFATGIVTDILPVKKKSKDQNTISSRKHWQDPEYFN